MSERSDSKKKLGRILLQRKLVSPEDLDDVLTRQRSDSTRLATIVADLGKADTGELAAALGEQQGIAPVDLDHAIIPIDALKHVPQDLARHLHVLPLAVEGDALKLAMADPRERRVIDEIELVVGKRIQPYVALDGQIARVIDAAYAALLAGHEHWAGERADGDDVADFRPEGSPKLPPRKSTPPPPDKLTGFEDELSRPLMAMLPPGVEPSEPPGPADFVAKDPARRTRILVVDDSDDIRQLLVRVFREREFEVLESARGLDALDKVRAATPDVIVLDAMLPEVHGFDICRRIKGSRRYGHIPVIMVSAVYRGWRFADDLKRSYGVDAFLEKPFRIADMLAAVERALLGAAPEGGDLGEARSEEPLEGAAAECLRAGIDAYARGDVDNAITQLRRGITQHPLAFRLHYHLGLLYGKLDNVFEAIQVLETAAELRPRDFSTLKNLAVLYQRAGFRLKATEMWERALGSAPDDETRANIKNHLVSLF
jgi:DNA-binding response OmpR family regulator